MISLQIDNVLDINSTDGGDRNLNENSDARMIVSSYLPNTSDRLVLDRVKRSSWREFALVCISFLSHSNVSVSLTKYHWNVYRCDTEEHMAERSSSPVAF